ncbi:MAG: hypothetical protein MZV63_30045 [Marinilabiliales bacterium]|nr:hypothetical protein [Marinilabiliales bacterium]
MSRQTMPLPAWCREAVADSWSRLLAPSMETEFRKTSKEKADEEAIRVFADNLRQLLLCTASGREERPGPRPGVPHRL